MSHFERVSLGRRRLGERRSPHSNPTLPWTNLSILFWRRIRWECSVSFVHRNNIKWMAERGRGVPQENELNIPFFRPATSHFTQKNISFWASHQKLHFLPKINPSPLRCWNLWCLTSDPIWSKGFEINSCCSSRNLTLLEFSTGECWTRFDSIFCRDWINLKISSNSIQYGCKSYTAHIVAMFIPVY